MKCRVPNAQYQVKNANSCALDHLCSSPTRHSALGTRHFRPGFSFTEILFAVMILGIGFIMVAAMFPVAIAQTEANNQETITASVGRQGASYLNELANILVISPFSSSASAQVYSSVLLPTFTNPPSILPMPANQSALTISGEVWSFYDFPAPIGRDTLVCPAPNAGQPAVSYNGPHAPYLWSLVAGNLIQATDHRFAWVAMYKRDFVEQGTPGSTTPTLSPGAYAQVIMIGVRSRVKQSYDPVNDTTVAQGTLLPTLIKGVSITPPSTTNNNIPTIDFKASNPAVAENAYVVISDDGYGTPPNGGLYNGRIYRLGTLNGGNIWNFAPGEGPSMNDAPLSNASVFVVGQGIDPTAGGHSGGAQDVTAYTTYVQTP